MNAVLYELQTQLTSLSAQIMSKITHSNTFAVAGNNNWSYPSLTREDLVAEVQSLIDLIEDCGDVELNDLDAPLQNYISRIKFLRDFTIPNLPGSPAAGVVALLSSLQSLRRFLTEELTNDDHAESVAKLRKLTKQVRSMEARLKDLDPRTTSLLDMVSRIEAAHDAADQLPTDLASLSEARDKLGALFRDATKDHGHIEELRGKADVLDQKLRGSLLEAEQVLQRCQTAYSAATSVGLAAAFTERSEKLSTSMWVWVGGLVAALGVGSFFGSAQLQKLSELIKQPEASSSIVFLNLLLSLLSVGAPVWFGWLATKQIGQRFRLAEDYAFKASISRAYEGFRREAARIDKDMEARLLSSALTRLDELPLRLVETDTHGSPWHELASSDLVKDAVRSVPGFAGQVKDLAAKAMNAVAPSKPKMAPAAAADETTD